MVHEIVLAIDPFLGKIEKILLWKNKLKSCAVFTFCHLLFWMFLNYNIRTYCTISSILLFFHLLDAYRTKKRRQLIRLTSNQKNLNDSLSSLGKFVISLNNKLGIVYTKLNKLKRRNRLLYFLTMLTLWSMLAIIGTNVRGFYLCYILFWAVFFVPAVVHFDIPKKVLSRLLPLLEQLDHSMKYERRSVLDKSELLVDVKHPNSDELDQAEEDEYLRSFQLGDLKGKERRVFDNLDEESLWSEHTEDGEHTDDEEEDEDDDEDEEIVEEIFEVQTYRNTEDGKRTGIDDGQQYITKLISQKSNRTAGAPVKTSDIHFDFFDPNNDSLLPDEFLPNVNMSALSNSLLNTTNEDSFSSNSRSKQTKNADLSNKVLKNRRVKARPSLLDYYADPDQSNKISHNEGDIDETFDFLDEELDKY